jgi:ankyrin repeat protein
MLKKVLISLLAMALLTKALASDNLCRENSSNEATTGADEEAFEELCRAIVTFNDEDIYHIFDGNPHLAQNHGSRIMKVYMDAFEAHIRDTPSTTRSNTGNVLLQHIDMYEAPHFATIRSQSEEEVRSLLSTEDFDINQRNLYGNTLLMVACMYGNLPVVRMILSVGPDQNARTRHDKNALHFALDSLIRENILPLAELLLQGQAMHLTSALPYKVPRGAESLAKEIERLGGQVLYYTETVRSDDADNGTCHIM